MSRIGAIVANKSSLAKLEFNEPSKQPKIVYKFKIGSSVWWFNGRSSMREVWTVKSQEIELGQAYYGLVKDGELRQAFEGALELWVDLEAQQRAREAWEELKLTAWAGIDDNIRDKAKESLRGFKQGTTASGDYYRHNVRWSSSKADFALMTYGQLYNESMAPTGVCPSPLAVCDPEMWRDSWRDRDRRGPTFTERGFPSRDQAVLAVGSLDERFGNPDPHFAPLPAANDFDFVSTIHGFRTSGESFNEWKQKVKRVPTGNHRRNIYIAAMDDLPNRIMSKITAYIKAFFCNVFVSEMECPPIDYLPIRHRMHEGTGSRQLNTNDIAHYFKSKVPSDAFALIVITMEDLYDDSRWNYSLGSEFRDQHTLVLSLARFDPAFWRHVSLPSEYDKDLSVLDQEPTRPPVREEGYLNKWRAMHRVDVVKKKWHVNKKREEVQWEPGISWSAGSIKYTDKYFQKRTPYLGKGWTDRIRNEDDWEIVLRRACKFVSRELVFMCGVQHCLFFNCLMNGTIHLREFDKVPMHLCPVCLHKHMSAIGIHSTFRTTERYVELKDWFKINKPYFYYEAKWVEMRECAIERSVEKSFSSKK